MNEDKMIAMLSNLDDDLLAKEIDNLMDGVECDMESINRKAHQKLEKHSRKAKLRKRLSYAAAVCACFICINTVYADEISTAVKSFFNKTPVYSTMVDGRAYYLNDSLVLDDKLALTSFMVADGRLDMEFTSKLGINVLKDMKIVPKDAPNTEYVMGGYSEEGDKYTFSFMNGKEDNYNIKPFQTFNLVVGGKTYVVDLDAAKSFDGTEKLATSEATSNKIDMVTIGANSIENNGKQAVQLIASFKDKDMKLTAFGNPADATIKAGFENLGQQGISSYSNRLRTEDIYATDKSGIKHKLSIPADAKARPITTFETGAPKDSQLTINLPALLATYEKSVDSFTIDIPKDNQKIINRSVNLFAQKAVIKSIKRISPTSAELVWQLNTGTEKYVSIRSFHVSSKNIKKVSSEFTGDKAVMTLEFDKDVNTADLNISWPHFVMRGNWTINLK